MAPAELKLASLDGKARGGEQVFQWHSHPFIEWGLVLEGRCTWYIESESYELAENEMIMVPQGLIHRELIEAGSRSRLSWVGFCSGGAGGMQSGLEALSVLDGMPVDVGADRAHMQMMGGEPLLTGHKGAADGLRPLKLPAGRWWQEIRRLFVTIYDEQSEPAFGSEARIRLALGELLLLAVRTMLAGEGVAEPEKKEPGKRGIPLRQMQLAHAASRFFDNNTEQGVTIESVARYFRLTPQYFSTLFRKVHGMSPVQYQQAARVRCACRLLTGSRLSVKEIASRCGYADSAHFCRQFKAHENCSPTQYRLRKSAARA